MTDFRKEATDLFDALNTPYTSEQVITAADWLEDYAVFHYDEGFEDGYSAGHDEAHLCDCATKVPDPSAQGTAWVPQ